jgi:hypothetical protein
MNKETEDEYNAAEVLQSIPHVSEFIYEDKHLSAAIEAYSKSKHGTRTGGPTMVESLVFDLMRELGKTLEKSYHRWEGYANSL